MSTSSEKILVIPATDLPAFNVPEKGVLFNPFIDLSELMKNATFIERSAAENDPSWKQIIPYCVFLTHENDVLHYVRTSKGGENRLHNKTSIGFGGHVNENDVQRFFSIGSYFTGLQRELTEELLFLLRIDDQKEQGPWLAHFDMAHLGLINDNTTDVGKVHLGVLHAFRLKYPADTCDISAESNDSSVRIRGFHDPVRLLSFYREQLESWTLLTLENVKWENLASYF